jgi:hypothetical protein
VSPVRYELCFYIPEDILHSHRRENLKSYIALTGWALWRRRIVSPVRYELCFYIPEDDVLHSHCRENLKTYNNGFLTLFDTSGTKSTVSTATYWPIVPAVDHR